MAVYTIRPNTTFSIVKNNVIYVGGDSVDLTPEEVKLHKHKLEGIEKSYEPLDLAGVSSPGYLTYKSAPVSYINGALIVFAHGWEMFDPLVDWYMVQAWAICNIAQAGWQPGEIALLNGRRSTIEVTSSQIKLQVGGSSISIGRKNDTMNEFNMNPSLWQLFVTGIKKE